MNNPEDLLLADYNISSTTLNPAGGYGTGVGRGERTRLGDGVLVVLRRVEQRTKR